MKTVKFGISLIDIVASKMIGFRPAIIILLASILITSCKRTQTASEALGASQGAVASRQIQSRIVEVRDDRTLIQTVVATLQDFGFKIKESNATAGLVTGSKSQLGGGFLRHKADVRVTVTATQVRNNKSSVRAIFQKVIPSHDPRLFRTEPILDRNLYQKFFNSVEQSLFLSRNEQ
jgi:hypothetical protein